MTAPPAADTDTLAAIARLTKRVRVLEAEVAAARERNEELRTARDFADSLRSGHIDRGRVDG